MQKINYLRSCRKQAGLSQQDVSFLVDKPSLATISKMEDDSLAPDLATAFCFSLLYQRSIPELFPKLCEDRSIQLLRKVDRLSNAYAQKNVQARISGNKMRKNQAKQDFLRSCMDYIKKAND
jgi:transcriptional regulator with XRE-family HTH domain